MSGDNWQTCPKLYECTRIQMTPMIRALRRCSANEAMQSICDNCTDRPLLQKVGVRASSTSSRNIQLE